jgi:hypothetical protein
MKYLINLLQIWFQYQPRPIADVRRAPPRFRDVHVFFSRSHTDRDDLPLPSNLNFFLHTCYVCPPPPGGSPSALSCGRSRQRERRWSSTLHCAPLNYLFISYTMDNNNCKQKNIISRRRGEWKNQTLSKWESSGTIIIVGEKWLSFLGLRWCMRDNFLLIKIPTGPGDWHFRRRNTRDRQR